VTKEPDLTGLLRAWNCGDRDALAALVQESYLRLLDWRAVHWAS
jgi:hypothetical protein